LREKKYARTIKGFHAECAEKKTRRVRGEILVRVEIFASMAVLGGLCVKKNTLELSKVFTQSAQIAAIQT
jgi:hypothetical protein